MNIVNKEMWLGSPANIKGANKDPVHTNPFSNENGAVLFCFQKDLRPHLSFSYCFRRPHYNAVSALKTLLYPRAHAQMNSTHAHFNISARETGAKLKPHGSLCPPFWILTLE